MPCLRLLFILVLSVCCSAFFWLFPVALMLLAGSSTESNKQAVADAVGVSHCEFQLDGVVRCVRLFGVGWRLAAQ